MAIHTLELFSGVGMLGEGLRAGLAWLGVETRTVCHVERESYAAAVLVARMEDGSMDAAPVWSDVSTFDARRWRGGVDCVIAGFPCQDLSLAGRRAGLDGARSGLFFDVVRIATDCGARLLFLENVGGIASATATVMDEAEGELEERAASRVVGELCGPFAPGPSDPRWGAILDAYPYLAPALEPGFRVVADGVAVDMGDNRAARLRCVGNGVVPQQAAAAFVVLARRAGILIAKD